MISALFKTKLLKGNQEDSTKRSQRAIADFWDGGDQVPRNVGGDSELRVVPSWQQRNRDLGPTTTELN